MKKIVITLMLFVLIFTGCSNTQGTENQDSNSVKDYLQAKGYEVISDEGIIETYKLTNEKLMNIPYSNYWGLQSVEPSKYLGKEVKVQKFIVTNHPLDNWQSTSAKKQNIVKSKGKTNIWVYIIDDEPVGGHSYPVIEEQMYGGVWSLEGKTLEEVHSISYQEWVEQWKAKFGN